MEVLTCLRSSLLSMVIATLTESSKRARASLPVEMVMASLALSLRPAMIIHLDGQKRVRQLGIERRNWF